MCVANTNTKVVYTSIWNEKEEKENWKGRGRIEGCFCHRTYCMYYYWTASESLGCKLVFWVQETRGGEASPWASMEHHYYRPAFPEDCDLCSAAGGYCWTSKKEKTQAPASVGLLWGQFWINMYVFRIHEHILRFHGAGGSRCSCVSLLRSR